MQYKKQLIYNKYLSALFCSAGLLFYCVHSPAEELVAVVNLNNPISEISKNDLINIYMGRSRQFANGNRAVPIDNKACKADFYSKLVNKSAPEIKAYWARLIFSGRTMPPQETHDSATAKNILLTNKNAIAYIPASQIDAKVKVIYELKELK